MSTLVHAQHFTPEVKDLVLSAMKFGYAAAFCEKVADMQGSYSHAQEYQDGYNSMVGKLK